MPGASEIAREEGWGEYHLLTIAGRRVEMTPEQWEEAVLDGAKGLMRAMEGDYSWHELNPLHQEYFLIRSRGVLEAALKPGRN